MQRGQLSTFPVRRGCCSTGWRALELNSALVKPNCMPLLRRSYHAVRGTSRYYSTSLRMPSAERLQLLEKLGRELGVKEVQMFFFPNTKKFSLCLPFSFIKLSDWYTISPDQVKKVGGSDLLNYYSSLKGALRDLYPGYPWEPKKFAATRLNWPSYYWLDVANQKKFLELIGPKLGIVEVCEGLNFTCT